MKRRIDRILAIMISMIIVVAFVAPEGVYAASKKPSKVIITSVKSVDHDAIKLTWKKTKNAKKYQIYRATSKNGKYKKVKTTTARTYINRKLTTGKKYYYKVRALNGSKKGSFSVKKSAVPTLKTPTVKTKADITSVKITWNKVSGAKGYQIYRSNSKNSGYKKIKTTSSTSYNNSNLPSGKTYYYKLRAYKKVGGKTKYSPYRSFSVKLKIKNNVDVDKEEIAKIEFRKKWIAEHITAEMTAIEKVTEIQRYVAGTQYGYGLSLYVPDKNGVYGGVCTTGANFMYDLCKDLGIKCEQRFAGDDTEKYHINYGAAANHVNCFVWIDGERYLADCTPGTYTKIFKWTPERWELKYKISKGEIPITEGLRDEEPTPVNGTYGANEYNYLAGYNISMPWTKDVFSIPNKCTVLGTGKVLETQISLYFGAEPNEIKEAYSSDENVIKFREGSCTYAEAVGIGTAIVTVHTDDLADTVWTYKITVY